VVGTTGSGKSIVQRLLMKDPLVRIKPGMDQRAVIFDAKGETADFLQHVGVSCPVFNLNPFAPNHPSVKKVAWDIARDINSPARAQNLASSLIPAESSGNNRYFTDAARQIIAGVVESFITHSPDSWTFPDLVYASLSQDRIRALLSRDEEGQEVLDCFFADDRTAYQVFTTVVSRMAYFKPVAALWQRTEDKIGIKRWLESDSILLLGSNATVKTSLDAINEQIFRVLVEEIDIQSNSDDRRTWIWIDEARLAGSMLKSDLLPYICVKGRSRGAAIVLAFQDIDGFREAAGERIANEIVAQCSHKALLRMESESSATWASKTLGRYETIHEFRSENVTNRSANLSEQGIRRDAVLASEFFGLPETNKQNGLAGFFVSPREGASRHLVDSESIAKVIGHEAGEQDFGFPNQSEFAQKMTRWSRSDCFVCRSICQSAIR
jgi:type IV secretory pathway TraG/TraD family ATPase VirD4